MTLRYTLDNIGEAAVAFWNAVKDCHVLAFSGDLGAGKTTFIHALCDHLQVPDAVSSPTFALINEYHFDGKDGDTTIYHLDWYRLRSAEEAIHAGMEDCIDKAAGGHDYCFIEWPERARELLRAPYYRVSITALSATEREMTLQLVSARN